MSISAVRVVGAFSVLGPRPPAAFPGAAVSPKSGDRIGVVITDAVTGTAVRRD
jgi:hypothetical protein